MWGDVGYFGWMEELIWAILWKFLNEKFEWKEKFSVHSTEIQTINRYSRQRFMKQE